MTEKKQVHNNFSRRDFLKSTGIMGAAVGSAALAGCAPKVLPTETAAAPAAAGADVMTADMAAKKWSFEIPPEPIPDSDIANTVETEVVVIGAGTSGLMVANSAVDNGAKVVLISASEAPVSRGGSNHAYNSKTMQAAGFEPYDANTFMREELMKAGYNVDQDKWWKFVNNSEEAMNWLIDVMEEAGYQCVLEGGYTDPGNKIMNMPAGAHSFIGDDVTEAGIGQPLVVKTLAKRATDKGVQIVFKMKAEQLVREDNNTGRVSAVIAKGEDGKYTKYVGTKAVVMAMGDFSADKEMMAKYCPSMLPALADVEEVNYDVGLSIGGLFKGEGHKMGLWVGAAWQRTFPNCPMVLSGISPSPYDYSSHPGLVVNKDGYRFMNEDTLFAYAALAQMHQPERKMYAIWDANYAEATKPWFTKGMIRGQETPIDPADIVAGWEQSVKDGAMVKGDTVEAVIEALGLPAAETKATVDHYNELSKNGVDTDYHKRAERMASIETGPFYGSKSEGPAFLTVLGGLRTNINMQVCDENDTPIPGLFNVGTMIGDYYANMYNFIVEGNNYGACCVTFGYLTGKAIATGAV
jgi:fumarate reductase flavoprotein subunit